MNNALNILLATTLAVALWQAIVSVTGLPVFILPPPMRVLDSLIDNRVLIAEHALVTASEVAIGMLLGCLLGVITAINLTVSAPVRSIIRPILVFSQSVPVFALAPVLTLWLGYGLASKAAMTILIIYFPVTSAFFDGLMNTPSSYLDLAQSMRARPSRTLWLVRVPAALPALLSGLRLAAVYAPIGAVIGEWVGASRGLGYLMLLANGRAKIDLMFAALLVLGLFAVLLYAAIDALANRLTPRN